MDSRAAGFTVSTAVLLVMAPDVAVMLEVPMPRPGATPPALIEATEPLLVCQVTEPVTSAVLLSVNVPVAVNDCVRPLAIEALAGEMAIDCRVAAVTVSTAVLLVMAPEVAGVLGLAPPKTGGTPLALVEGPAPLFAVPGAEPGGA